MSEWFEISLRIVAIKSAKVKEGIQCLPVRLESCTRRSPRRWS